MRFVQTFDPTATASGVINIGTGDPGQKILIYNESATTLEINFQNGNTSYIHAWEANYWTIQIPTYELEWSAVRNLVGAGQSPASFVDVFVYGANERVEGTYPVQLARLINTGNLIAVASTGTNIINDGNAANSQIIEATQTGSSGSNVSIDNSGNAALKQYVSNTLTTLFQVIANAGAGASNVLLSDTAHRCEVLGNLLVDLALTVTGNASIGGNLTVSGSFAAGSLQATSLTNDGAAASTQIIESKQSGSSGSNVSIDNSGNMTLKQYVSATLTQIFQVVAGAANGTSNVKLSDASHQCEVLGSLLVDAALTVSGALSVTGNSTLSGTLTVAGAATLNGNAGGTSLTTANDINAGGQIICSAPASGDSQFQAVNSSGVVKDVLYINSANNLCVQSPIAGKVYIRDNNGNNLFSVDSSGNVRAKGTVTASVTP